MQCSFYKGLRSSCNIEEVELMLTLMQFFPHLVAQIPPSLVRARSRQVGPGRPTRYPAPDQDAPAPSG